LALKGGWRYDLHEWFLDTFLFRQMGRELRQRTLALAALKAGDQVLDVGCGTGTLALEAQRIVGSAGHVVGIDPSEEQISRAHAKAARQRAPVEFQIGLIEQLAFPDQTFDVVLSTLMMHHLPTSLKQRGFAEIARVLKPWGRLVIADFVRRQERAGLATRFHAGGSSLRELAALASDGGFVHVDSEEMPAPRFSMFPGAGFVKAAKS
jgi:ubiquinone/menaquinone biosynthesis C-methylase UbiE